MLLWRRIFAACVVTARLGRVGVAPRAARRRARDCAAPERERDPAEGQLQQPARDLARGHAARVGRPRRSWRQNLGELSAQQRPLRRLARRLAAAQRMLRLNLPLAEKYAWNEPKKDTQSMPGCIWEF